MDVLLAEDDAKTAQAVIEGLSLFDIHVYHTADGEAALVQLSQAQYDVAIVDRMMPKLDGLEVIRRARAAGYTVPILMLSAMGEVEDRVSGLRAGADDYLSKPFSLDELVARLEVLSRRATIQADAAQIVCGELILDLRQRVASRMGQALDLKPREFSMLLFMVENCGKLVTRAMLLEHVFKVQFDPQTNVIDVHMSRLRTKLEKGFDAPLIRTVRGAGFILDEVS